ncbi:MAG: YhfC family glutamic-type intramembrane protease [Planctomycetota bacterium]|jgi:uncharacterized membrane protein YhfC
MLLPYAVYFLGPFLLAALLGKRLVKGNWSAFLIGLPTFFAAWLCVTAIMVLTTTVGRAQEGTIVFSLVIASAAGIFEECGRFAAFRLLGPLRRRRDWPTGMMYAIGHSGMESIIVGGTLVLTVSVVTHAPEILSDNVLEQVRPVAEMGFWAGLYVSLERLFVGLLIHACFTCVVLLALAKGRLRYLLLAVLWHFAHDMVALNIGHLSDHWIAAKLWVLFIVVAYAFVLLRLRRALVAPRIAQAQD